MSDADIIDTIADRLVDLAGQGKLLSTMAAEPGGRALGLEVLAALRGAGYEMVTTEEAKLKSLENRPKYILELSAQALNDVQNQHPPSV